MQTKIKELKNCLLISDYHLDFYELARSRNAFGKNIECEVWFASAENPSGRLPWFDIYADGESTEDSPDAHLTTTSFGTPSVDVPADRREIVDPAHDDVPAMKFYPTEDEKQSNLCLVQTDKLFGKTIRQCAVAWAKHHGLNVTEEDVIVISDFKPTENNWPLTDETSNDFHQFENDLRNYNPELLIRWGLAHESIYDQLEQQIQEESADKEPPKKIQFSPEALEQMRQSMSEEEFQQQLKWIEDFNQGKAQAKISRVKNIIFDLINKGTVQQLQEQLANGLDVNTRDNSGRTLLHLAAMKGELQMVRILLDTGADVNATYEDDCSPLYLASQCGHTEIVKLLLEAGADTEKALDTGHTALLIASQQGHTETVKALLQAGADTTAVRTADRIQKMDVPFSNETVVISGDGFASLSVAVQQGHLETVKALLDGGADINAHSENIPHIAPLHLAVFEDNEELVTLLVQRGADVNIRASDGCTSLHMAVVTDKPNIVKRLLDLDADLLVENNDSTSVIEVAIKEKKEDSIPLLLDAMSIPANTSQSKGFLNCLFKSNEMSVANQNSIDRIRNAAQQNNAMAQYVYALCYVHGYNVEKDVTEAANWFRKAAQQGQPSAQYQLALCYLKGTGVEENSEEAMRLCRQAAENGNAWAQFTLGNSYLEGDRVEQDAPKAITWIRKAALQGLATSMRTLGRCYEQGVGVEQDITEAIQWYRKAVGQGDAVAQYYLGCCYENGIGVEQNKLEARTLYCKSMALRFPPAFEALEKLLGFSFVR